MDLDGALAQFDRTESNLRKLEAVLAEIHELVPAGIEFAGTSPEGLRYGDLQRQYADLVAVLPKIDGFHVMSSPPDLDEIAQTRLDALHAGIPEATIAIDKAIAQPAHDVAEYRHRLERARTALAREPILELVAAIDIVLPVLVERHERGPESVADDSDWQKLRGSIATIRRLLTVTSSGKARWPDLRRHLHFAQANDLHDIADYDWPSVRADIESRLYAGAEPLPVDVEDLGTLVTSAPAGTVTTALAWGRLESSAFERLIFNVLSSTMGYQKAQWLTSTTAPDKGRDLSAERTRDDPLSGTTHERVIVQCKHWLSRAVGPHDVQEAVTLAETWEPGFDAVIVATSGRFTTTAIEWVEKHNKTSRLTVEMWPESHLEQLLAERGYLVEEFNLR
jgi:hypothetical protein